jgi:hypothetical protein
MRRMRRAVVVAGLALAAAAQAGAALDWRQPWSAPRDPAAAATQSDEYAWRLFVALNWPAERDGRRAAPRAAFGADRPVVWERWQNVADVYLPGGRDPGTWAAALPTEAAAHRFESSSLKDLPNLRHMAGGVMVPVVDPLGSARRLTEIRMNRQSFEFIRARGLFSVQGQLRVLETGEVVSFPFGACDVKAKWRPITEGERARYHTTLVILSDGTSRLYGLTALHIASKDLPNWLWATFEHVENPKLADNEGWQLPSRDTFACGKEAPDCNRAPRGIGLEGTVWQYYRLRGTLRGYSDAQGAPALLANSELERGMQRSSSCITCHSRAAIGVAGGEPVRRPVFASQGDSSDAQPARRGFIGEPTWLGNAPEAGGARFAPLDFVWSMTTARGRPSE